MPRREDESWVAKKEDLRYCNIHKKYYRVQFGCQLCYLESTGASINNSSSNTKIEIQRCPDCNKMSLAWFEQTQIYECMNKGCKRTFTKYEIENEEFKIDINTINIERKQSNVKRFFGRYLR